MENSILQRGTTPVHSFTLPDDLKEVELAALYITYAQSGTVRLEKTMDEVAVNSGVITVQLNTGGNAAISGESDRAHSNPIAHGGRGCAGL